MVHADTVGGSQPNGVLERDSSHSSQLGSDLFKWNNSDSLLRDGAFLPVSLYRHSLINMNHLKFICLLNKNKRKQISLHVSAYFAPSSRMLKFCEKNIVLSVFFTVFQLRLLKMQVLRSVIFFKVFGYV